jgi:Luciferase-like monooxygenase
MSIETLADAGPVHWGVMLAQGWKGELAATGREKCWVVARDWASHAEFLGFHGVWVFDHFQPYPARDDSPVLEAWTTLAALSQVTERVVIGTLVSCVGYRNPAVTVKMAENLHVLSTGRFCLGLGAGWDRPEFELLDIPFPLRRNAPTVSRLCCTLAIPRGRSLVLALLRRRQRRWTLAAGRYCWSAARGRGGHCPLRPRTLTPSTGRLASMSSRARAACWLTSATPLGMIRAVCGGRTLPTFSSSTARASSRAGGNTKTGA